MFQERTTSVAVDITRYLNVRSKPGLCSLPSATKLRQVYIFTSVCQRVMSTGWGVSASVHAGIHPRADTPPGQTPTCQVHAGIHTRCMLGYTYPQPPLPSACWDRHGYCCRQYASYWNAFLFGRILAVFHRAGFDSSIVML